MKSIRIIVLCCFSFAFSTPDAIAQIKALGSEGINVHAVHEQGITGTGVNIALLSAGNVRNSHIAFQRETGSVVKIYDFTGTGFLPSSHDTHMAGIILSAGSPSHPKQIGVAPGARLLSGRISNKQLYPSNIAKALDTFIKQQHCRVIMTGIQLPKEIVVADGNSRWSKMYDYYAETYDVLIACAAGNSGSEVTVFGDMYNGITTAGAIQSDPNGLFDSIGSISNPGPTADGRKKPEIAACTQGLIVPDSSGDDYWSTLDVNGRGLTSYAVPHTAGVAALLFEAAAKNPVENDDKTEVIKAIMINSSNPFAFETNTSIGSADDSISAWKPDGGYGILDAFKAYKTLMSGPIEPDIPTRQKMGWAYGMMGKKKEHKYIIQAEQGKRLLITVTWHRKLHKIGSNYVEETVPFHLNLRIVSPSGKMLAFESVEPNNLIKTDLLLKENGQYKIVLKNPTSAENRDYGVAFELISENPTSASN